MASELSQAIQQVCEDKKIPIESVISTIESALGAAYRKDFGHKMQNIKVEFNIDTGGFKVFDIKEVVENELKETYEKIKEEKIKAAQDGIEPKEERDKKNTSTDGDGKEENEEEIKKFNPKTMISLDDAKEINNKIKLGEELVQELEVPGDFGRMAAQTAKQVIIQKLREVEKDIIFNEYKDKQGDLIKGTIQRQEGKLFLVDLSNATGIMPITESIRAEKYMPGSGFKFYIKSVEQGSRGPEIVLSRTNAEILRKLFKLEVPEISSGTVQIKSIAREAGSRSKVAVWAKEDNIDPIGSCVGQRGTRVQTIINELGGEKIDIIEWDEDPIKFISKSLSPAKTIKVELKENDDGKQAKVYVNADQLSLAIGKEGQNVRLAAKLTGWRIDIVEAKTEEVVEVGIDTDENNNPNEEHMDAGSADTDDKSEEKIEGDKKEERKKNKKDENNKKLEKDVGAGFTPAQKKDEGEKDKKDKEDMEKENTKKTEKKKEKNK